MKYLLASTAAVLTVGLASSALAADKCSTVVISSMNWQSAQVLAALDKAILSAGYGCDTETIEGDTVPSITSMIEKGQPDVAPEGWINLLPEVINKGIKDGKIISTGPALSDGAIQGWFIPKYLAEAHPDIKTIKDALEHPDLFPAPEDPSKGAVFNGPEGWGGTVVTHQYFKAYDGEAKGFVLVSTGSSAGLDGSLINAYEHQKGWLGYYWEPTSLLGKYDMVKLDYSVPYDAAEWKRCNTVADCPDPKPNAWPVDTVDTLVTTKFADRADPAVIDYFKARSWSNATVNKLLAWMTDNQATGAEGARHFLKTSEDLWTKWVTPDAAEKIKASVN